MKYLAAIDLLGKILWYKNRESTSQKTFYFLLQIQQFPLFVKYSHEKNVFSTFHGHSSRKEEISEPHEFNQYIIAYVIWLNLCWW